MDYLCEHVQEVSRSALLDYGAVARVFTEPVAIRYGMSRLRLLLTYKDATKLELNPEEPGPISILVPDKKGLVTPKPFENCTVEDLRQTLKHLRESVMEIRTLPLTQVDKLIEALLSQYSAMSMMPVAKKKEQARS